MKKSIQLLFVTLLFSTSLHAGFWSSALGTAVGGGGSKNYYGKDASEDPKKIQQTLSKLGFYSAEFDGNLNSFDTRSAIEEFQSYYRLKDDGILNKVQKQDLLYVHDLIKNYKIQLQNPKNKDTKRLQKLYESFDKIENKLSNNKFSKPYMSIKFKDEIKKRREFLKEAKNQKAKKRKQEKIDKKNKQIQQLKLDKKNGTALINTLMWKKCPEGTQWTGKSCSGGYKGFNYDEAIEHASAAKYAGYSDWRMPTFEELSSIVVCKENGKRGTLNKKNGGYESLTRLGIDYKHASCSAYNRELYMSNTSKYISLNKKLHIDPKIRRRKREQTFNSGTISPIYTNYVMQINFRTGGYSDTYKSRDAYIRLVRDTKR